MGDDKAPLLLQRECRLSFEVREGNGEPQESWPDFDSAVCAARATDSTERMFVDLVMSYDGLAANQAAASRAGKGEKRLGTWEIFLEDAVYCPTGRKQLGPDEYKAIA